MDFEKAKKLLKESIDEGANLFEIMEIFTDKVYEQGKQDGNSNKEPEKEPEDNLRHMIDKHIIAPVKSRCRRVATLYNKWQYGE